VVTAQKNELARSPGVQQMSHLLNYLPSIYRDDEFMEKFLLIFESILNPIVNTVDNLALYFDPGLTPEPASWLASWVGLALT
jgi:phage tail-like protein